MAAALVATSCIPYSLANGLGRSDGDYWVYDIEMIVEGVPVTGTLTYDFVGSGTLLNDDEFDAVDIFRITGSFEGSSSVAGIAASVSGVYDGYGYTVQGGVAIVMSDMSTFVNVTHGIGTLLLVTPVEAHETAFYLPPLMSGFDQDSAALGDIWNETVETRLVSSFDNGSVSYDEDVVLEERYAFSVDSVDEVLGTAAGEFNCVVVSMSYESGNEVTWYCPDAGRPVRTERYINGSSDPCFVAELSEHSFRSDRSTWLVLLVGLGIGASTVILVFTIVLAARRSRAVAPSEEATATDDSVSEEEADGDGLLSDGSRSK